MSKPQPVGRRTFMRHVAAAATIAPAITAVAQGFPGLSEVEGSPALPGSAAQQPPTSAGKVTRDALKGAEQIAGLKFTDAEEEMALAGVNRNLDSFDALRKIDIPLDTEPAFSFRPYLPGARPKGRVTRNAKLA